MKKTVIRVDGSAEIGMGHIMRCLALARGIEKAGKRADFLVRDYDRKVSEIIRHNGYNVKTIPADCSWNDDLNLTLGYSDRCRSKIIITDLGNAGNMAQPDEYRHYLQGLKNSGKYLVAIDDLVKMSLPADIIINPHYGVEKEDYGTGESSRLLLGPAYFIFRQEFIDAARENREIKDKARNLLIAIGGTDPLDVVGRVVRAVVQSSETRGLNLRIVLGMDCAASKKQEMEAALKDYAGQYELLPGSDNMAELMLWSDVTVTGGGLTKYEVAVTGTPGVVIPQYDYLIKLNEEFDRTGAVLSLGFIDIITDEAIVGAIAGLLGDAVRRREMSRKGRELVDGRGIERIIAEIPEEAWA